MPRRPDLVLAFVGAHPDDDVMGAAGLIAKLRDHPSLRFVLVHATDEEAGQIAPGSPATRETLGRVRRDERIGPDGSRWVAVRTDMSGWACTTAASQISPMNR